MSQEIMVLVVCVQEYDFKRGFKKDARERVLNALNDCFETDIKTEDDQYVIHYGALRKMTVAVGDKLQIETESEANIPNDIAIDTNGRFRNFLEKATGFTAKQRAKKAQESVKDGV